MGAIQDVLDKFGKETVSIIQGNLSSTDTNATGKTSASLQSDASEDRVTVTGKPFIYVVETGRKPGRMPPISPIIEWLNSGKVSISGNINSAAFAIARTIAEKGTVLFRQGGRKDIITPAISDDRIDQLTSDIADVEFDKTIKVIDDGITGNN